MFGLGGELAKEVAFVFIFLFLFCASPFCDVHWLAGSPFYKAGILYNLFFFSYLDPFCNKIFCLLCLAHSLEN